MIEALEAQGRTRSPSASQHRLGLAGDHRVPGRAARARSRRRVRREAVGDEPFAVLLPDELMGDSSLLAQMNGVCAQHRRQRGRR